MVKLYLLSPQKEGLLKGNPYSLLYLEEWIRRNSNVPVEIVQDFEQIKKENSYVGISITTPTYQKSLNLIRKLKRENPTVRTILGGYHTKGQSNVIIQNHPEIDFVVEGEGEKGLVKILEKQTDKIVFGEPLTSEELNSISIEDLIKLNPEYFKTMRQFGKMNYISTRGCPYSCFFCASSGRLSKKSTEKVTDDLEILSKEGFKDISIQDNYFGYNPQRIREICNEILGRRISINWDCQTRAESMQDESLLRLMADAGCTASYIGTENFHPDILKKMNKTKNIEDYLRMTGNAIRNILVAGIKPYLNLQVGFSYEDNKIIQTNINALEGLGKTAGEHNTQIEIYPHLNVIYPGTPDFYSLVKDGIAEDIFESFTFWEEGENKRIKSFLGQNGFIHGYGGIPLGILDFEKLKDKKFEIDEKRIAKINEYIIKIRDINGIKITDKK